MAKITVKLKSVYLKVECESEVESVRERVRMCSITHIILMRGTAGMLHRPFLQKDQNKRQH